MKEWAGEWTQRQDVGLSTAGERRYQMLADYARLRISRHPVWPYHPRIWELRHSLGAYDAAYIALAEALAALDAGRRLRACQALQRS